MGGDEFLLILAGVNTATSSRSLTTTTAASFKLWRDSSWWTANRFSSG